MLVPFGDQMVVDLEAGVVRNVPILGAESPTRNRSYSTEALRAAVTLFEGIPFYGDRGKHEKWDEAPSPFDLIGCIENPHFEEGELKIRADIRPVKQMVEWFLGLAEDMPTVVGPSPVMRGATVLDKDTGKEVVVQIVEAQRVDLVSRPSTVSGLHESANTGVSGEENEVDFKVLTQADLLRERPDLVTLIETEAAASKDQEGKMATLTKQVQTLTEDAASKAKEVDDLKAEKAVAEKVALAETLLAESGLPPEVVSDVFKGQVGAAKDEAAMTALIEERKKLVETVSGKPISHARSAVGDGKEEAPKLDDLAAVVKGT